MKPITIKAMVAGVQAGRISAVVFIFSRSFSWRQPILLLESKWEDKNGYSRHSPLKPNKKLD
jgi:hypothetical protein